MGKRYAEKVYVRVKVPCEVCHGRKACPVCGGRRGVPCGVCEGTGRCPCCNGHGYVLARLPAIEAMMVGGELVQ